MRCSHDGGLYHEEFHKQPSVSAVIDVYRDESLIIRRVPVYLQTLYTLPSYCTNTITTSVILQQYNRCVNTMLDNRYAT